MTSHKRPRGSKPSWSSAIMCSGWANGRASIPPGMDSSTMLRHWRCLPAGHCTIAQPCCEPCMYRHHVCSRWQRGIDKHAWQSSWSAAPAERVNVASWRWLVRGLGRAQCIAMSRSGALHALILPLRAVFRQPANSTRLTRVSRGPPRSWLEGGGAVAARPSFTQRRPGPSRAYAC